tara:strand:- start:3931 stop:4494 length:564 start_codon:yes stop_codon:yes gene_type:complete
MTIANILELPKNQMLKHIDALAKEYKTLTGRTVCRTCGGDVSFMLGYLKNYKLMGKFEFKNNTAIYRVAKGSDERISHSNMTDAKAIDYLSMNKERIGLFKSYPENWEQMVDQYLDASARVMLEHGSDCCEDEEEVPCDDCLRTALLRLKMKELKEQYPEIPLHFAMKKAELVEAIIQVKLAEAKKS